MTPIQLIEAALREHGAKGGRGSWTCPAHEDRSPSLSVREGDDGRALVHCFAGCETADVLAAIGLGLRDLFDGPAPRDWTPPPRAAVGLAWAPPRAPIVGRIGLPTWDDVFWAQDDDAIDAHFARVMESNPASGEIASLDERQRRVEVESERIRAPRIYAPRLVA